MTRLHELKQKYDELFKMGPHEKMIYLVAALTTYFEGSDVKPVIVGGLSVEIYTRSNYTTFDIDIITPGRDEIDQLLTEELNFEKTGRSWYHKELELSIEIPSNHLEGDRNRVVKLNLPDGGEVYVVSVEDIIIHRLESAVINRNLPPEHSEDYEWAKRMFELHKNNEELLDKEYLANASIDKQVNTIIADWLEEN